MRSRPASPPALQSLPLAPSGGPGSSTGLLLGLLLLAALVPRLSVLPFNENLHGDAAPRTELAQRWAEAPHWITSFHDGACQFGPLHLYALGVALKVWPAKEHAGRLLSLVVGVLTVVPLFSLTRRLFGARAAIAACLAFAAWGLHVQLSTTAASEALGLLLVLGVLALFAQGLEERTFAPLALSALILNLACAVRYDAWMLAPLLVLLLLLGDRDRVASATRALLFGLFCLPFPLLWMHGNELATGDALYPIHYVDRFHVQWFQEEARYWGQARLRLMNLFFWPGAALVTLSPLVALLGAAGMARAWRQRPQVRWLIWVAAAPTLYFAVKGVLLGSFVPLARFTVGQLALLLPFVTFGFDGLAQRLGPLSRRALVIATASLAVLLPAGMAALSAVSEGDLARSLSPVSPVSRNPRALMKVARWLKDHAPPAGMVVIDRDRGYRDLQIGYFSALPASRVVRAQEQGLGSWPGPPEPVLLVRLDGGALERDPALVEVGDGRVRLFGFELEEVGGFERPYRVYRRLAPLSAGPASCGSTAAATCRPPPRGT